MSVNETINEATSGVSDPFVLIKIVGFIFIVGLIGYVIYMIYSNV